MYAFTVKLLSHDVSPLLLTSTITAIIFVIKTTCLRVFFVLLPSISTLDTTEENIEYVTLLFSY